MIIKSIRIVNFQSWKDAIFDFTGGLNVLLGKSNTGKTAALRAFAWVATNKPSGEAFRSHWGGDTSVEVVATDDHEVEHKVTRLRSKTKNQYIVDGKVLEAMGQGVPEEVAEIFNMDDLNWHKQHDSAFLLSKTSGEVARQLNKVAKLDSIDLALTAINSKSTNTNTDLKQEKEILEELEEKASKYDYLEDMERDIRVVEKLVGQRTALHEKCVRAASVIEEIKTLTRSRVVVKLPTTLYCDRVLAKCEQLSGLKKKKANISLIISDILATKNNIAEKKEKGEVLANQFKELMPNVCPFCGRGDN